MLQEMETALTLGSQVIEQGAVADYIPELAKANPKDIAISVYTVNNENHLLGDIAQKFTIQSVVKVALLACALKARTAEVVFKRVGVKPSAEPFNSILDLELSENFLPVNPYTNAGAILSASLIDHPFEQVLAMMKKLTNNPNLTWSEEVYQSERDSGDKNRALAYLMKARGVLDSTVDVKAVLEDYFKCCSILVDVVDLGKMSAVLGNGGIAPWSGEFILPWEMTRTIVAIMTTCGLYDYSGEFAVDVGIPAKSGVGGAIIAAIPGRMGIAVYSPALDTHGNSTAGVEILRYLSKEWKLSVFEPV